MSTSRAAGSWAHLPIVEWRQQPTQFGGEVCLISLCMRFWETVVYDSHGIHLIEEKSFKIFLLSSYGAVYKQWFQQLKKQTNKQTTKKPQTTL